MILYDILWYIMIYYDILWYIMIYYDILWYIMIYYDILWYIMIYYDILWYIMIDYDILWYIMIYYDILWYIMIYYDILWYYEWENQVFNSVQLLYFMGIWAIFNDKNTGAFFGHRQSVACGSLRSSLCEAASFSTSKGLSQYGDFPREYHPSSRWFFSSEKARIVSENHQLFISHESQGLTTTSTCFFTAVPRSPWWTTKLWPNNFFLWSQWNVEIPDRKHHGFVEMGDGMNTKSIQWISMILLPMTDPDPDGI